MVEDEDYRRKAKIALVAIVLLASLAVFASFVAFAYYCYIRNQVSKRRRNSHKVEDAANLNEKSDIFQICKLLLRKDLRCSLSSSCILLLEASASQMWLVMVDLD
ncbi:argonaute 1, variant 5 [Lathyrus oleraceus]|uniref:Argonaute 1, variant 5 n=2 Tax=Pisum sativum TaxID=3888 RepID=A0A9D4X007_PEA|nr:argonaute 1, variant 5 [Pisum sativum]